MRLNQSIKLETTGQNVTKICKICGQEKYLLDFHKNGTWTRPECKQCNLEQQKIYSKLKKEYPTPEVGTPCYCCGKTSEKLQLDHDHNKMTYRGWLCSNCNTGIGKLGDNIEGVQKAVDYLEDANTLESITKEDDDLAIN